MKQNTFIVKEYVFNADEIEAALRERLWERYGIKPDNLNMTWNFTKTKDLTPEFSKITFHINEDEVIENMEAYAE